MFRKLWQKIKAGLKALQNMKIRTRRRLWVTVIAAVTAYLAVHFFWPDALPNVRSIEVPLIPYTQFFEHVEKDEVEDVLIRPDVIIGRMKNGTTIVTRINSTFVNPLTDLRKHNVTIVFGQTPTEAEARSQGNYAGLLCILIGVIWGYFFFFGIGPQGEINLVFWRRSSDPNASVRITFEDVAGVDEAKADLQQVVSFLKKRQRFGRFGGRIPQGMLLVGPPGTGKTLLARAVAGEAGVPFFAVSGADFAKMYVGIGPHRVRELWGDARAHAPCIIYIDEVDAIAGKRHAPNSGGDHEFNNTTNQLLIELDGFNQNPGVIFLASTNAPENLDPAFLRPGRIDRQIVVPPPDARGREAILKVHIRKKSTLSLAPDVDLTAIALGTPGFSGADLANIVNEAALMAEEQDPPAQNVTMRHFMRAKDKVLMGAERKSLIVTDADKLRTAYHEVGHAFVALRTAGSDPVEKVSVMPRGRSLGVTVQLPPADRHHYTKSFLTGKLAVMMGGRAAEEIFYAHDVSAGAESDIEEATKLASNMVCLWGMSEKLGLIALKKSAGGIYVNRDGGTYNCSPELAARADEEVRALLDVALKTAHSIIEEERALVKKISRELFLRTELSGTEIQKIIEEHARSERSTS